MLPHYFLHVVMTIGFGAAVSLQELDHRLVLGAKEMTSKKTAPGDVFLFFFSSSFFFFFDCRNLFRVVSFFLFCFFIF